MKEKDKQGFWLGLFSVMPVTMLWPLGEYFAEPGFTRTLISAGLGGLGAALGGGLYFATREKPTKTKIIVLISLLVLGIVGIKMVVLNLAGA